ncbi:hypothetical protein [Erwinia billingiae]|uniref:hypothetical protein n=1 Tax=Erwinia billingiae TaxID=182337 RepID=UPI0005A05999|nr:hypothetical protein [Erwinia billingiae]
MSELNFEAMGRCEHLRKEITECLSKRDMHAQRVSSATRTTGSTFISNTITSMGISKIEKAIEELKEYETKLRVLVDEYNQWADKAGKPAITFMSNAN